MGKLMGHNILETIWNETDIVFLSINSFSCYKMVEGSNSHFKKNRF
jgi:hypothetical protein